MDRVHNGCWIVLDDLCVFVGFSLFTVGVFSGPKKCLFFPSHWIHIRFSRPLKNFGSLHFLGQAISRFRQD